MQKLPQDVGPQILQRNASAWAFFPLSRQINLLFFRARTRHETTWDLKQPWLPFAFCRFLAQCDGRERNASLSAIVAEVLGNSTIVRLLGFTFQRWKLDVVPIYMRQELPNPEV